MRIPFFPSATPNTPSVTKTLAPSYAKTFPALSTASGEHKPPICSPPPMICHRGSIKEGLRQLGGMSSALYLVTMLQQKDMQRAGLQLIQALLSWSPQNVREMRDICGYQMLGRLLRREKWQLDETLLGVVFEMVGVTKSQRVPTYSSGVISNLPAFKNLLLDWKIWERSSPSVQKLLFRSLADLVATHELAAFNIKRFRQANVIEGFFRTLRQSDEEPFPLSLGPSIVTILRSVMTDSPSVKDLQVYLHLRVSQRSSSTISSVLT